MAITPEVLTRIAAGDENSLAIIYDVHFSPLYCATKRFVCDPLEAQAIVASSFMQLWNEKICFNKEELLIAWLYGATKNACLTLLLKSPKKATSKNALTTLENLPANDPAAFVSANDQIKALVLMRLKTQRAKIVQLPFFDIQNNTESYT